MKKDELLKETYTDYKREAKNCGMLDEDILTFDEFVEEIKKIHYSNL